MPKNNFFVITMKKGMELSINMLVVIILGIFILSAGFIFLNKIVNTNEELLKSIDQDTQTKIENSLSRGELVAIPNNVRNARFKVPEYFGIGIKNKLTREYEFKVIAELNNVILPDGTEDTNIIVIPFMNDESFTLAPNEAKTDIPLSITIPEGSPKGTYIFNIDVQYNNVSQTPSWITYKLKQIRLTI